jgi:peptide/nickel transport system substrate-binding protein
MKSAKKLFILFSLLLVVVMVLAACGGGPAEEPMEEPVAEEPMEEEPMEEEPEAGSESIVAEEATPTPVVLETSEFGEAPMLADMVAAGDLPPVEERLPVEDDILVVSGVDGIGEYGGIWHNVTWWSGFGNVSGMGFYDPPVRWKRDYTGYEPGLAKEWIVSEDGTTVTWVFREGVKWSDGVDFIPSVDLGFWWEMANDEDIGLVVVPWWGFNDDGSPMDLSFPDDYTMVMKWTTPHYITNYIVAQGFWEWLPLERPKHFLSQFHPDYTDGMTYDDLTTALDTTDAWIAHVEGYPCLHAWCLETYTPGERAVWTRNPYYWKVDAEGNQLPYIDKVEARLIEAADVRVLEASQGKFEASFRASTDPVDIPFLLEQAEAGDYYLHPNAWNGAGGWPCWLINQNYANEEENPDTWEEIGALLRDKNFRQGMSHAMDRERLIDVQWDGIGEPAQGTISPQAWHFASPEGQELFDEWNNSYVEYNPDLAMELFDTAGFVDADGDGVRDLPSGAPFTLILDMGDWSGVPEAATESYAGDLEDVGMAVLINPLAGTPEWGLRQDTGLYMLRNCHASELDIWTYPDWLFPLRNNRAWPLEGLWRQTGGEEGWEPKPGFSSAYELQALYDLGLATADIDERHEIVWDAVRIHLEEGPFTLGGAGDQSMPVVVRNGFMGIPDLVILGPWAPGSPGNLGPEQFWMQEDLRNESLGQ